MYADLDYYKHRDLADMPVWGVFTLVTETLETARLPHPTLAVATGRGLAVVWRHTAVSRAELPRWNACQGRIWGALRAVGSDRGATDSARVLRLIGTVNSRSGALVEAIWENPGELWDFEHLVEEILPDENEQPQQPRRRRRASRPTQESDSGARGDSGRRFSVITLNQDRLEDLHRLMDLRGWEMLPAGKRDSWMLVAASCLSQLHKPDFLEEKVCRLAREVAGWSPSETKSRMHSVFKNAKEAQSGGKVRWEDTSKDPRYGFTNQRIIEELAITPAEEQEMKTIISEHTRRRRDRMRKEKVRREQGAKPRKEYMAEANKKRKRAKGLREKGFTYAEIAKRIGCSERHVPRLLSCP